MTASRPFAWQLAKTESQRIQGHWLPRLGPYMGPKRSDYMAHRIAVMEDRGTGRLAGPRCDANTERESIRNYECCDDREDRSIEMVSRHRFR